MGTDLATRPENGQQGGGAAIERRESMPMGLDMVTNLPDVFRLSNTLAQARGFVPDHLLGQPGSIAACILAGRELGVPPMAALRGMHVVKGKVGLDYSVIVGLLRRAGYGVSWKEKGSKRCVLRLTRGGEEHVEKWDEERARAAGLWASNDVWKKYPETMLAARCVSSAARSFAGDVLTGVYTVDEVHEIAAATGSEVNPAPIEVQAETVPPETRREVNSDYRIGFGPSKGKSFDAAPRPHLDAWARRCIEGVADPNKEPRHRERMAEHIVELRRRGILPEEHAEPAEETGCGAGEGDEAIAEAEASAHDD